MAAAGAPGGGGPERFTRRFFEGAESFTLIGTGQLGGKAAGLLEAHRALGQRPASLRPAGLEIEVPTLAVIGTDVFSHFLERNGLADRDWSGDSDRRIAQAFQRASLPAELAGDLWALVRRVHQPLAVRSSSLLEDALGHPFAGVYATKMIPNSAPEAETRFRKLTEALRFVYASTFFREARAYRRVLGRACRDERMAVIVQEVVGALHGARFYPDVSGVARSLHFYATPPARPQDGVLSLALGLGKTIVDGGRTFTYSPAYPLVPPPCSSPAERLDLSQREFWAVNMGPATYDPLAESEHLVVGTLADAQADGTLGALASTYDVRRDRLVPGLGPDGPRTLDFAPLLRFGEPPLSDAVRGLLELFSERASQPVEIELALTLGTPARLGFLQVRPMAAPGTRIELREEQLAEPGTLVASRQALGDGRVTGLFDVVYVKPQSFDRTRTPLIAAELEQANARLAAAKRPYLLIGFGRWGSADRFLGVPADWGQVSGAAVIVEAALPGFGPEMSQGAHFFHNLLALGVPYLCVSPHSGTLDFAWLDAQPARAEGTFLRQLELPQPLEALVDGRHGWALVRHASA